MTITVVYNQITTGTCKHQEFKDPFKAFDKFYSMLKDARRDPFISSDEHIGFFTHNNVEWYMLNDDEGKALALRRFKNWLKEFRKVKYRAKDSDYSPYPPMNDLGGCSGGA